MVLVHEMVPHQHEHFAEGSPQDGMHKSRNQHDSGHHHHDSGHHHEQDKNHKDEQSSQEKHKSNFPYHKHLSVSGNFDYTRLNLNNNQSGSIIVPAVAFFYEQHSVKTFDPDPEKPPGADIPYPVFSQCSPKAFGLRGPPSHAQML